MEENKKDPIYVCRRVRVLNHLLSNGFMFLRADKDKYKQNYNVWLFKDTPELRNSVEEYYSRIPNRRKEVKQSNSTLSGE